MEPSGDEGQTAPETDVFVSYARADKPRAARFAQGLRGRGLTVWWDDELLGGDRFVDVIETQLNSASVVVVLWSRESVKSDFVQDEARVAKARSTLVPVRIDDVDQPLGFGGIHAHSLMDWDGRTDSPEFDKLMRAIGRRLGPAAQGPRDGAEVEDTASTHPAAPSPAPVDEPVEPPPRTSAGESVAGEDAAVRLLRGSLGEALRDSTDVSAGVQVLRAHVLLADRLRVVGSHGDAVQHYLHAEQLASTVSESDGWRSRIDAGLADSLEGAGLHDEAIVRRERVVATHEDAFDLVERILARLEQVLPDERVPAKERYEVGSRHFRTMHDVLAAPRPLRRTWEWTPEMATAIRPRFAGVAAQLAFLAIELADRAAAIALFELHLTAATKDSPECLPVLEQLGHEYLAVGDLEQAPGTDAAHALALDYYEVARDVFAARGSTFGLRQALRRCAEMAVATGDMESFDRYAAEHQALGEGMGPSEARDDTRTADDLHWPLHRLSIVSVAAEALNRDDGLELRATAVLENSGSLGCPPHRGVDAQVGVRHTSGTGSRTSARWVELVAGQRIRPGEAVTVPVETEFSGVDHESELFVEQVRMPWEDRMIRVVRPPAGGWAQSIPS